MMPITVCYVYDEYKVSRMLLGARFLLIRGFNPICLKKSYPHAISVLDTRAIHELQGDWVVTVQIAHK